MGYIDVPAFFLNGWVVTSTHVCTPTPFSISEGGLAEGSSLVQSSSITVTATKYPSDIAKEALDKLGEIDPEYWNSHDFVKYLQLCEQKGFRIKGYDTGKGKIVSYPLSYNNRWGPVRRRELAAKLDRLQFWFEMQEDRPVTMVTMTASHKDYSISGAWQELNKSRDKLRKLIFKYFGAVDYFWVVEPHKSGYAHYHMAVFADVSNDVKDKKGKGIEDKFRDIWSKKYKTGNHTFGLNFSKRHGENGIKHLKNYLQKYLAKGFLLDKWSPGMLKFNAAMWDTGFRMYGASKSIREIMNISDDKADQIVWLETKIQEPAVTPKGEQYESDRVVWYRQYIPDWVDSDFWLLKDKMRLNDPDELWFCFWGRGPWFNQLEYAEGGGWALDSDRKALFKETSWQDLNITQRKHDVDPYEEFNKKMADKYRSPREEEFEYYRRKHEQTFDVKL